MTLTLVMGLSAVSGVVLFFLGGIQAAQDQKHSKRGMLLVVLFFTMICTMTWEILHG